MIAGENGLSKPQVSGKRVRIRKRVQHNTVPKRRDVHEIVVRFQKPNQLLKHQLPLPEIGFVERPLALIQQVPELAEQLLNHFAAVQEQADHEEPGDEAEVLGGEGRVVGVEIEVVARENGVVENEGLVEKAGLAGSHVVGEVELSDARGDVADFGSFEAAVHQLLPILLLELPYLSVHFQHFVEVGIVFLPEFEFDYYNKGVLSSKP